MFLNKKDPEMDLRMRRNYERLEPVRFAHKTRVPFLVLERGKLRSEEHCLLLDKEDGSIEIPGSLLTVIFVEPGVTVTHEAVKLCAQHDVLLVWCGEGLTRIYATSAQSGNPQRIIQQCRIHSGMPLRIAAAKRLYSLMFDDEMPPSYSIEKLRGIEGQRVKVLYAEISKKHGVYWQGRENSNSELKSAIGFATSCLYAISEAAILSCGYQPSIGIVHSGDPRSLVFDLADTIKFKTVVPKAFEVYARQPENINQAVRHACRDYFRSEGVFETLVSNLKCIFDERHD